MALPGKYSGWRRNPNTSALSAYVNGQEEIVLDDNDHIKINVPAAQATKTIRINSQTYTADGSIIGAQIKPRAGVAMTGDLTGLEVMPGIGVDAVTSTKSIIGINVNPYLHATAGAVTGDIRGIQVTLEKPAGAGTVTGEGVCLKLYNNMNGTVTGGVYAIDVKAHGGTTAWSGFAHFDDITGLASVTNGVILADISATANAGWIKVVVGTTVRYIPLYALKAA